MLRPRVNLLFECNVTNGDAGVAARLDATLTMKNERFRKKITEKKEAKKTISRAAVIVAVARVV